MIFFFNDFLNEFNKNDKYFIQDLSDYFTLSIEYELVADFELEDEPIIDNDDDLNLAKDYAKKQTLLDISRGKFNYTFDNDYKLTKEKLVNNEIKMKNENNIDILNNNQIKKLHVKYFTWTYVNDIIDSILNLINIDDDDDIYIKKINKFQKNIKDDLTNFVINKLDANIVKFIFEQNMQYLKYKLNEYLPKFVNKWGNTFKYELESDSDKKRILEFSPKTYINSLNECFEQLNDFYNEFENQNFWVMNERTALHVNIGIKNNNIKWNPIKGLLLMNDLNRDKRTPFVFSNIMWRLNNRFTKSLLDTIKNNLTGEINIDYNTDDNILLHDLNFRHKKELDKHKEYILNNLDKLNLHNIDIVENFINDFLIKANSEFYIKEFGIKLTELKDNNAYIEFRYVGGNVNKQIFIDKILYFCYIVYIMTNKDYKKEKYLKKLYKYIEYLKYILNINYQ